MVEDFIARWWSAIAAVIGVIAWLIRMEAKMVSNSRDIERLWKQRKEDMQAAKDAREDTNALLHDLREDVRRLTSLILERKP